MYGVGPIYVAVILVLTAVGTFLSAAGKLDSGHFTQGRIAAFVIGILLIFLGILCWIKAACQAKIDDGILHNYLVTGGIYAWVRNPIYSAFLFLCTGILLFSCNIWLLALPLLYWVFLTILMKGTEEKWLTKQYGEEYAAYCRRTNRSIPWFPRKG